MRIFSTRSRTIGSATSPLRVSLYDSERLTAGWLALALLLIGSRLCVLRLAGTATPSGKNLLAWLPLAIYQDLALVLLLGFMSELALRWVASPAGRFAVRLLAWSLCVTVAWYSIASIEIFRFLSAPLTYRLIAMSDNLRGIRTSMESALTYERVALVAAAPAILLLLVTAFVTLGANWVRSVRQAARLLGTRLAVAGYFCLAWLAFAATGVDSAAVANPHLTLVASLWDRADPLVEGSYHESDLADFIPAEHREPSPWQGRAEGLNIIMVVMESVGASALSHYGYEHPTTPELSRLARQGLTFNRIYASQPYTSNAMVGIFCSLYPWHGWRSVPRRDPGFQVPGIGNVLQSAGYRTAILHTGDMQFDNEKQFLERHGFQEVHDVWSLHTVLGGRARAGTPVETDGVQLHLPDDLLLPAATSWIDNHRSQPFFLTLWTIQTHHPYFPEPNDAQFDKDPELNRYLNAIRVTDRMLGDLFRELEKRQLVDSTLVIVLGDHGEAFGQHANRGHSKTLYDEEVRVPLVMLSPRLAAYGRHMNMLGQQIDIAPTILDLIGLDAPSPWQGKSLFANDRTNRAYLFTAFHHYLFGMIDGDKKYIWNATTGKAQSYDLVRDPDERINLVGPRRSESEVELHRRIAAWVAFQNRYLAGFLSK